MEDSMESSFSMGHIPPKSDDILSWTFFNCQFTTISHSLGLPKQVPKPCFFWDVLVKVDSAKIIIYPGVIRACDVDTILRV